MGKDYIHLDELNFPRVCPSCGSTKFLVEGAKKIYYTEWYEVTEDGVKLVDSSPYHVEWEVAYGIECANCGEDLSDLAGF